MRSELASLAENEAPDPVEGASKHKGYRHPMSIRGQSGMATLEPGSSLKDPGTVSSKEYETFRHQYAVEKISELHYVQRTDSTEKYTTWISRTLISGAKVKREVFVRQVPEFQAINF